MLPVGDAPRLDIEEAVMNQFVVATGVLALTAAGAANAGGHYPSREESIGLVSGAGIGAAVGGPPGAIIGAVLGGWLGDRYDTKKQTIAALNQRLVENDQTMTALNFRLIESQSELADLNAKFADSERRFALVQQTESGLTPAIERSLRGEIMFRTKDASLNAGTSAHLIELGEVLAVTSNAVVQLDGYADPRGTKAENLALSEQRAASVRDSLVAGGLPADRIVIRAHGESQTQTVAGDVDGFALERRVVITISGDPTAVAQSTESPE
jgi:outer membrane protein OmpA-like peptidoglycan-associated protein